MHTLSISAAIDFLDHVAIRHRSPVMMWGQPGVGKTQGVNQLVAKLNTNTEGGAIVVDVRLGQYDSVDLRGLPDRHEIDGTTIWRVPATLPFENNPNFPEDGLIVLFLDEMNACAPSVYAVAMQLTNEGRVGEHKLRDNVRIIAAGNRESDKGVANRMPTTQANRFTHIEVGVDVEAWCYHAQKMGWPAIGVAFMQFRKQLLSTFDPSKPDKAFATPRTWERALQYFADEFMPEDVKMAAISGAIGDGPAAEFWAFVDIWQKVGSLMSKIRSNPEKAEIPKEPSMQYAITVALSGEMDLKTVAGLHKYLVRMSPEFVVLAWQLATKRDEKLFKAPEFTDFSNRYRVVFA